MTAAVRAAPKVAKISAETLRQCATERSRRIWHAVSGAGTKGIALPTLIHRFEGSIEGVDLKGGLHLLQAAGHVRVEGEDTWARWIATDKAPAGQRLPLWRRAVDDEADIDLDAEPRPAGMPRPDVPNSVFAVGEATIDATWGLNVDRRLAARAARPPAPKPAWAEAVPVGFSLPAVEHVAGTDSAAAGGPVCRSVQVEPIGNPAAGSDAAAHPLAGLFQDVAAGLNGGADAKALTAHYYPDGSNWWNRGDSSDVVATVPATVPIAAPALKRAPATPAAYPAFEPAKARRQAAAPAVRAAAQAAVPAAAPGAVQAAATPASGASTAAHLLPRQAALLASLAATLACDPRLNITPAGVLILQLEPDPASAVVIAPRAVRALFRWLDDLAGSQLQSLLGAQAS